MKTTTQDTNLVPIPAHVEDQVEDRGLKGYEATCWSGFPATKRTWTASLSALLAMLIKLKDLRGSRAA